MKTRAIGLVAALAALVCLLLAEPSSAAPTVPKGTPFSFQLPGDGFGPVCDFPVLISGTSAALPRTVLPNGLVVVSGPTAVTVTNVTTGESVTYNISGPGKIDPLTNNVTFYGLNLIYGPEGQSGPSGRKFLWLTSGTVSFTLGQPLFEQDLQGHIIDVCAELAA